ncbi:MAG: hypothetical protein ACE5DI_01790 [Candidatus Micrarchaeia archaeon]
MRHARKALEFYSHHARHRRNWFNAPYRLLLIGLAGFLFYLVHGYLEQAFLTTVLLGDKTLALNELLFQWFVLGAVTGTVFFALLSEGEILLGLRKVARSLDADALSEKPRRSGKKKR